MTSFDDPKSKKSWIGETVKMVVEQGYRVVPVYSDGKAQPFAKGQTYPNTNDWIWERAEVVGVVLDDVVLLDYDGNKADASASPIVGLEQLAAMLDIDQLPTPVQTGSEGRSLHFLFRRVTTLERASADGVLSDFIDVKTGNQLMHLKLNKTISDNELPPKSELPECPSAIVRTLCHYRSSTPVTNTDTDLRNISMGRDVHENTLSFVNRCQRAGESDEYIYNQVGRVAKELRLAARTDSFERSERLMEADLPDLINSGRAKYGRELEGNGPNFPDVQHSIKGGVRVLATHQNVKALMSFLEVDLFHDVMQKRARAANIPKTGTDENDLNILCAILESEAARWGLSQNAIPKFLDFLAFMNPTNPPLSFLESNTSNAFPNAIEYLVQKAGMTPPDFALIAVRRWLIQACAAADSASRGISTARAEFGHVLVLVGAQGVRKTSLLQALMPAPLQDYFSAGRTLDLSNKDSQLTAISNWIVELGELDSTFRKSDIAQMKAFLTNQSDQIRRPYAREASKFPRRTVYAATVNYPQFLMDITGNRRFWPVTVTERMEWPSGLAEAIWSEAWRLYVAGGQWWLTEDEEIRHAEVVDGYEDRPLEEAVRDFYDFDLPDRDLHLTTQEILSDLNWPRTDRGAATSLGMALRRMGVDKLDRLNCMPPRRTSLLIQP